LGILKKKRKDKEGYMELRAARIRGVGFGHIEKEKKRRDTWN
jgi:hypothetical protein